MGKLSTEGVTVRFPLADHDDGFKFALTNLKLRVRALDMFKVHSDCHVGDKA